MTEANFNIQKVSSQVKTQVAKIISGGKVVNAADTQEEHDKLGELLSGTKNEDEKNYISSKMQEYKEKYKLQDLRSRATTFARNVVDKIKNLVKADGKIDADEAKHLSLELKNAMNENRLDDAKYIAEELRKAGFEEEVKKAIWGDKTETPKSSKGPKTSKAR